MFLSSRGPDSRREMTMTSENALVTHLFAARTGPRAADAAAELRRVWQACGDAWGMSEPVARTGLPAVPPADEAAIGSLAARHAPDKDGGLREAIWVQDHDITCVSIAFAESGVSWEQLADQWTAVVGTFGPGTLLGTVQAFTGVTVPDGTDVRTVGKARTLTGVDIWRLGEPDDDGPDRLLALVGPDAAVSSLIWTAGQSGWAPLTRYLLHAAKLRYEVRVWREQRVHRVREEIDEAVAGLRPVLLDATGVRGLSDAKLAAAEQKLDLLNAGEAGLVDVTAQVHTMLRTVRIAQANMRAHATRIAGPVDPGRHDLFTSDLAQAEWFEQQLDDDAAYLTAARDRATHLARAADRELRRRRDELREQSARRQEQVTLLQTAVLGGALFCLAAVQAFGYRIPVPAAVTPAVIALISSGAFYLYGRLAGAGTVAGVLRAVAVGGCAGSAVWLVLAATPSFLGVGGSFRGNLITLASLAAGVLAAALARWTERRNT